MENSTGVLTKQGVQVCFVNSEQPPVKIVQKKMFTYSRNENDFCFYELCEVFYPHPDAPDCALVSFLNFLPVSCPIGFETSASYTIDAGEGLSAVLTH